MSNELKSKREKNNDKRLKKFHYRLFELKIIIWLFFLNLTDPSKRGRYYNLELN